jgi:hypothetical protein
MKNQNLLAERVNLRTTILAFILTAIGLLLMLWSSDNLSWIQKPALQSFVNVLGSTLVVTGLITIVWDLFGKRAFTEEILSMVSMSRELTLAGIVQVTPSFQSREIDWDNLFAKATHVDVLFYGSSMWRAQNNNHLRALARKPRTRLRVLLPDPQDINTMTESANRMKISIEEEKTYITNAIKYFSSLSEEFPKAQIQVWLMKKSPLFSVFRIDDIGVISFYSHQGHIESIPTIVCTQGGKLHTFIMDELNALFDTDGGATRLNLKLQPHY